MPRDEFAYNRISQEIGENRQIPQESPQARLKVPMQIQQSEVIVRTDADWAACRRARKSTSGGSISIGEHYIKT